MNTNQQKQKAEVPRHASLQLPLLLHSGGWKNSIGCNNRLLNATGSTNCLLTLEVLILNYFEVLK